MQWLEYKEVVRRLREHDQRFTVHKKRGKGSHRMVLHPDVDGKKRHCPLPYHGAKTPIAPGIQKDLCRLFELPESIFE